MNQPTRFVQGDDARSQLPYLQGGPVAARIRGLFDIALVVQSSDNALHAALIHPDFARQLGYPAWDI